MSYKLVDQNGARIADRVKLIFVCDLCGNTADFYHGMSTYYKTVKGEKTPESYCSEICVKKAVAA